MFFHGFFPAWFDSDFCNLQTTFIKCSLFYSHLTINLSDRKLVATFCEAIFEHITLVNVFGTSIKAEQNPEEMYNPKHRNNLQE